MSIQSLLSVVKENHICGELPDIFGAYKFYVEPSGKIMLLPHDTKSGYRARPLSSQRTFSLLPKETLARLEEALSQYIDDMSRLVDELYIENSASVLSMALDKPKPSFYCPHHGVCCGEIAQKFLKALTAIIYDIDYIANKMSTSGKVFEDISLISRFTFGTIRIHSYQPFITAPKGYRYFGMSVRENDFIISRQAVEDVRELARLKDYLYQNNTIVPVVVKVSPQASGAIGDVPAPISSDVPANNLKALLEIVERNHIKFTVHKDGMILYSDPELGTVHISSPSTYVYVNPNELSSIPAELQEVIRDEIAKQVQGLVDTINELYQSSAPAIQHYSVSDADSKYLICPKHGSNCGELWVRLQTLILAVTRDIERLASKMSSHIRVPFDEVVLEQGIGQHDITIECTQTSPAVRFDAEAVMEAQMLYPALLASELNYIRKLVDFRNELYNIDTLLPFTIQIE